MKIWPSILKPDRLPLNSMKNKPTVAKITPKSSLTDSISDVTVSTNVSAHNDADSLSKRQ